MDEHEGLSAVDGDKVGLGVGVGVVAIVATVAVTVGSVGAGGRVHPKQQSSQQSQSTSSQSAETPMPPMEHTSSGTLPVNAFSFNRRLVSSPNDPSVAGISPERLLYSTDMYSRDAILEISAGSVPVKSFLLDSKVPRFVIKPSSVGRDPSKAFRPIPRMRRFVRPPISVGRVPTKLFWGTCSLTRLDNWPISDGSVPWIWFELTNRNSSFGRREISDGSVPTKPTFSRKMAVAFPEPSHSWETRVSGQSHSSPYVIQPRAIVVSSKLASPLCKLQKVVPKANRWRMRALE
mmetsp:Transcript_50269/g.76524  ORF Transcript_50269/g.76524 Transcript_50269/m.76524 type:complete len:291 (-) Transcript_50269:235-1107(-)